MGRRSVAIRWPAKPRPEVTPSRRFKRNSGTSPPRARISTPTSGSGPSSGWWPLSSPPRRLTSTSGQRAKTASRYECCNHRKPHPNRRNPIRKGTIRHGSPLLEVRLPCDELARRLAVCMRVRCVHHDRLCLDFEREARWWAYSASPALRDTFRRDAFPVGKPANTPRELLDSLEEL